MPRVVNFKLTATGKFWMPDEAGGGGGGGAMPEYTGIDGDIVTTTTQTIGYLNGWRFAVGPFDLDVSALRIWTQAGTSGGTVETLDLWRVSDEVKIATVDVERVNGAWASGNLASAVTLSAGADYIVTCYAGGASRENTTEDRGDVTTVGVVASSTTHFNSTDGTYPTGTSTSKAFRGIPDIAFGAVQPGAADGYGLLLANSRGGVNTYNGFRYGWRFTVGASNLSVTHVRTYLPDASVNRILIHDDSDESVLVDQSVTGVADAWAEEELAAPVTLTAGGTYTISGHITSGGTGRYRSPNSPIMSSDITVDNTGLRGSTLGTTRPTTDDLNTFELFADFGISL